MSMMDSINIEEIGELADTADNYRMYATDDMARLPVDMRLDALLRGFTEVRDKLREFYIAGGGDPTTWSSDHD